MNGPASAGAGWRARPSATLALQKSIAVSKAGRKGRTPESGPRPSPLTPHKKASPRGGACMSRPAAAALTGRKNCLDISAQSAYLSGWQACAGVTSGRSERAAASH